MEKGLIASQRIVTFIGANLRNKFAEIQLLRHFFVRDVGIISNLGRGARHFEGTGCSRSRYEYFENTYASIGSLAPQ